MTKEEETPACASRFTRLKDLVAVGAWVERLLDLFEVDVVHGTHPLEDTRGESGDLGAWQRYCSLIPSRLAQIRSCC